jgi:Ca2+-binding RTX toxin-like protein
VFSSIDYTLTPNVENLELTGIADLNGTGNALANVLTGNSGLNILTGGAGNDTYIVQNDADLVVESLTPGIDLVQSSAASFTLDANVENLTLTGTDNLTGTGNALNNLLTGNSGDNVLSGGDGTDTLTGGAGNDTLDGGAGTDKMAGGLGDDTYVVNLTTDVVTETLNAGTDKVFSSITYTLGANVENLRLTGTDNINGTGNALMNVLTGNSGNNTLSGLAGNDTLRGGLGNDTVNGGAGNDTFDFGLGDGQDLIQDSSGSADKISFDGGINPLDLVISRQANDLRLAIHGSSDQITVQNWYTSSVNRTETIQAGNDQTLLSTQVDQLIQAMAGFTQQTGLTWDQGIDQQPQQVQTILAANWQ